MPAGGWRLELSGWFFRRSLRSKGERGLLSGLECDVDGVQGVVEGAEYGVEEVFVAEPSGGYAGGLGER